MTIRLRPCGSRTFMCPVENNGSMTDPGSVTGGWLSTSGYVWLVAVLCYGVGDLATTAVGMRTAGVAEAGPIPAYLLDAVGVVGFVALKLAVFAVGLILWRVVPDPHRLGVPLALATFGVFVTGWNLLVLSGRFGLVAG